VVNADAVVGNHVIVDTGASVGHDCHVDDFAQVEPGVRLGGGAHLGRGALCGIGSAVVPNCFIGGGAILGPRSVAVKPLPAGTTCVGVPARPVPEAVAQEDLTSGAAATHFLHGPAINVSRGLLTILVSSAGRRVELIRCFQADAKALGLDLRVLATDVEPEMSSACQAADRCFQVPPCTTPEFVSELLRICAQEGVSLVVPTIDPELQTFADQRSQFASLGTHMLVSSPAVVRMARNKAATAEFLAKNGIPAPRTSTLAELLRRPERWPWPVILKPAHGSGSVGICVAQNLDEAKLAAAKGNGYVAQELIRGREFTVNLFFDQAGKLRAAVPHQRCEVRAGEVSKGITRREPALIELAWRLGAVLPGAVGSLCFQAILPEQGQPAVFEINARFGGGYPLAHQAGATFTRWLLEELAGLPSTANNDWEPGVTLLRYDAAVFRRAAAL
jgi:carbamoyl-phosphate synthase large subunit